ncbi:hypothetical protein ORI89_01665 [Sphingobacterium sp. UT-1RO-CII-1]|uniref:hypothetical protein n=1 Tax=Sphingobacterium sp. UT-1RO-CII-1 TaxID=2995225 RepID=UPI00227D081F|nr:hypothetical protein [Sphingobacterium sp. UT-1RO-CII-1]MCY4778340.1 hypothetical protein [Sphingobacterium sp. UT-1RO-CII-1]
MLKISTTYRSTVAYLLSMLMIFIIASGVVFIHKEVTSTGEVVTHIHPYDFTKKGKPHHESDAEIEFLSVIFVGSYTGPDLFVYDLQLSPTLLCSIYPRLTEGFKSKTTKFKPLRGPPPSIS